MLNGISSLVATAVCTRILGVVAKSHTQELRKTDCRTDEEEYASKQNGRSFLRELFEMIKIAHEPSMPDTQASCDGKNIRKLPMPVSLVLQINRSPTSGEVKICLGSVGGCTFGRNKNT